MSLFLKLALKINFFPSATSNCVFKCLLKIYSHLSDNNVLMRVNVFKPYVAARFTISIDINVITNIIFELLIILF